MYGFIRRITIEIATTITSTCSTFTATIFLGEHDGTQKPDCAVPCGRIRRLRYIITYRVKFYTKFSTQDGACLEPSYHFQLISRSSGEPTSRAAYQAPSTGGPDVYRLLN